MLFSTIADEVLLFFAYNFGRAGARKEIPKSRAQRILGRQMIVEVVNASLTCHNAFRG